MQAVHGDDRPGRLAALGLSHHRQAAVLRRHVLSARRSLRPAGLQAPAGGPRSGVAREAGGSGGRRRTQLTTHLAGASRGPRAAAAAGGELGESTFELGIEQATASHDRGVGRIRARAQVPAQPSCSPSCSAPRPAASTRPSLPMVELTLDRMARGGMHDHLGGGFHRYSTDERWLVSHFEKMLYDQALIARSYLEAYQVTGKREYAAVARDIFDYVRRDLTVAGRRRSIPPRMPIRKARKGSSTSGPRPRSKPCSAPTREGSSAGSTA